MILPLLLAMMGLQTALAADVTEGPEAYISIDQQKPWSSARSCAAGCLRYNGVFGCNNKGYWDLGRELGCGCSPSNNCYCSSKFASSATSYVSACVSTWCDGIQDWADEVTSMLQIYGDYCATANVAVSTPGFSWGSTATPTEDAASSTPTETNPTRATKTGSPGAASTSKTTATTNSDGEKKEGLSQSDIVALAASLGVGIPSLLVAIITLVVQMRKRKRRAAEQESGAPPTAAASNVHLIHLHTPTPVQSPPQYQTPPPQHQYQTPPPGQQYDTTTWSYELDAPKGGNQRYEMK
ncbi:hypothetical protein V8F20_001309 [Naviculisporaceae sp. PSN 640]